MNLANENPAWIYNQRRYARYLLSTHSRDEIMDVLGESHDRETLATFLNHERNNPNKPLICPPHEPLDAHEQHKADIAASGEFIERLAS